MVYEEKIKSPGEMALIVQSMKDRGIKVAHCHGCYDVVHPGHLSQFKEAKEKIAENGCLIVSITADKFIKKGPGRPFFNEKARAKILSSLGAVDYVVIDDNESSESLIKQIKPQFYVKGSDYRDFPETVAQVVLDRLAAEKNAVENGGGKIVFTELVKDDNSEVKYSSSDIARASRSGL